MKLPFPPGTGRKAFFTLYYPLSNKIALQNSCVFIFENNFSYQKINIDRTTHTLYENVAAVKLSVSLIVYPVLIECLSGCNPANSKFQEHGP